MGAVSGDRGSRWLNGRLVAAVVVLLTASRLIIGGSTGLSFDEAYYAFWSQSLSVGYLDHPPMVALMIAAGRLLFGDTALGIRAVGVLALAASAAVIWRIGVLLFDRLTAALATLLFSLAPVLGLGFIITPDVPSVLFWLMGLWAVAEFMHSRRPGWWLVVGLAAGLGLWSKYTDALLPLGLLLFLVTSGERRRWLGLWQVWAGVLIGLAVFSPLLWWGATHDWAIFTFQGKRTVFEGLSPRAPTYLLQLVSGIALTLGPIVALFAYGGTIGFLARTGRPPWAALALPVWTSLPGLLYFALHSLHGEVQANWPLPIGTGLALIGAWGLARLWRSRPWAGIALVGVESLFGIAIAVAFNAQLLWQPVNLGKIDRTNETRDWPAIAAGIEAAAAQTGARWVATSGSYARTGEIATALLMAGSKLPVRQIDQPERWLFLPPLPPDVTSAPALYVSAGEQPPLLGGPMTMVDTLERHDRYGVIDTYWLFALTLPPP